MGPQPGTRQRPKTFYGIHMNFMNPIAIVISGLLASTMANGSMLIAPFLGSCVNAICVCLHQCPYSNCRLNQRSEGLLLDIRQHLDRDVSRSLNHSQQRSFSRISAAVSRLTYFIIRFVT